MLDVCARSVGCFNIKCPLTFNLLCTARAAHSPAFKVHGNGLRGDFLSTRRPYVFRFDMLLCAVQAWLAIAS